MTKFYSQHKEDLLLAELFCHAKGTCVEVGANDGVTFSNTKHMEEKGWQCILVEPTPHLCKKIRESRSALLFECAATDADGEVTLFVAQDHDLLSSVEKNSNMEAELLRSKASITPIRVPARTLDSILNEADADKIDFISIDVEGHELSVLSGLNLQRWSPTVLLIEDSTDLKISKVERELYRRGYKRFYRSGGNDWYAKPGEVSVFFMMRMLTAGKIQLSGLLKVHLPRNVLRILLWMRRKL